MRLCCCQVGAAALLAWLVSSVARAEADLDLILYGADGCVGHFAASHLAKQKGLKWAIAGRTRQHLDELARELAEQGNGSAVSQPEIIVAALDGTSDPKHWVARARAVITAAGPFSVHGGERLVQACAETGVHYADTSDEFYWQRWMIDRHDAAARQSGAKVVLSSGFCVLAGDLGAQLALAELGAGGDEEVSVDAWLETYNGGLSAGVINTGKAIANASYPKTWDADPYVLAPSAEPDLRVDSKVEGMSYPSWVHGEGLVVKNIFGPYDARLLRRSFTHLKQKVRLRVGATSSLYPRWTAFLAAHPGSWSKLAQCPSKDVFDDGAWAYRFRATAAAGGRSSEVLLAGAGDPGYRFTALGLAETGLCLAGRSITGCLKSDVDDNLHYSGSGGGVQTAMAAMQPGPLRKRLESIGLLKVTTQLPTANAAAEMSLVV